MSKLSLEETKELLENVEWATMNVVIKEKYRCLLIPEEKWQNVTNELEARLKPGEEWNEDWDY